MSTPPANAGRITTLSMTRPSGTLMGLYQVPPVRGRAWAAVMAMEFSSTAPLTLSGASSSLASRSRSQRSCSPRSDYS